MHTLTISLSIAILQAEKLKMIDYDGLNVTLLRIIFIYCLGDIFL